MIPGASLTPPDDAAWLASYLDAAERAAARAQARMDDPHAPNTARLYRAVWKRWGLHCRALAIEPLPVDPVALVGFLELASERGGKGGRALSPNSVRLHLAALCSLDQAYAIQMGERTRQKGWLRRDPRVHAWLSSWSRDNPTAPRRQAPAISVQQLDAMLAELGERPSNVNAQQHIAVSTRDRAILLVGVCAALRVSELVALTLGDVEAMARGVRIIVRRSKTDQKGHGRDCGIAPQARLSRCPIEALNRWLAIRGTHAGPLFCAVSRGGEIVRQRVTKEGETVTDPPLTTRAVQDMITKTARAAGVPLASAHSLRSTFATLAAERGRPLDRIADQGGWASLNVLRGYVRRATLFDDNASAGLLDL